MVVCIRLQHHYFFHPILDWGVGERTSLTALVIKDFCSYVIKASALQGFLNVHGCACGAGRLLVLCMMVVSVMSVTFSVGK